LLILSTIKKAKTAQKALTEESLPVKKAKEAQKYPIWPFLEEG